MPRRSARPSTHRSLLPPSLLALSLTLWSCGGDEGTEPTTEQDQAPSIMITAPANGTTVTEGTELTFTGTADDPEDGSLTASIVWSSNLEGALGSGGSLNVILSVGTHTVTATATDSQRQDASASVEVTVEAQAADQPPSVIITAPADGTTVTEGTELAFTGTAADPQDGDLTDFIAWSSDVDGALGTGGSVQATLSVGQHTVLATVTDSDGLEAKDSVGVAVTTSVAPTTGTLMAGYRHTCAIGEGKRVWCWGSNEYGQTDRTSTDRHGPVRTLIGAPDAQALGVGRQQSCAVVSSSNLYCWGRTSIDFAGLFYFRTVTVGYTHNCAIDESMEAYCWGGNQHGALGRGHTSGGDGTPEPVSGGHPFVQVSADWFFTCGLTEAGDALCWGLNEYGQLGDGTDEDRSEPVAVAADRQFVQIAAGGSHACALDNTGSAFCWGFNARGQLGDGTPNDSWTPVEVDGDHSFVQIAAGDSHTCALDSTGSAFCWGANEEGQLGNGGPVSPIAYVPRPDPVAGPLVFEEISAGGNHTCARTTSGDHFCWGRNAEGQLGNATWERSVEPAEVLEFGFDPKPTISIHSPDDGTEIEAGATLVLDATADDFPDGDLTSAIRWTSSIDGELGNGGRIETELSEGTHTIRASATDANAGTGEATITVGVLDSITPHGALVLVPDFKESDATLHIFDAASRSVLDTVPLAGGWPRDIMVSNDGKRAYVTSGADGAVSVVDLQNRVLEATVDAGVQNISIDMTPDGSEIWVSTYLPDPDGPHHLPYLADIDPSSHVLRSSFPVSSGLDLMVLAPGGQRAYAKAGVRLIVADLGARAQVDSVSLGSTIEAIAVAPDGERIYVPTWFQHEDKAFVYVIEAPGHTVVDSIPLGETIPFAAAVSPDGSTLWVSISGDDSPHPKGVAIVDLATETITGSVAMADRSVYDIEFNEDGSLAYVARSFLYFAGGWVEEGADIAIVDTNSLEIVGLIENGNNPLAVRAIAIAPGS